MAKKRVTLNSIMQELKSIKKLVLKDLQVDLRDVKVDVKDIKLDKELIKKSDKIFETIGEWKVNIWDECSNKKQVSEEGDIGYKCKLLKYLCNFEKCPLNIKRKQHL